MQNYKVRVNNEAENKEVQELFFELGYVWRGLGDKSKELFFPKCLVSYLIIAYHKTMDMQITTFDFSDAKELTIDQLRYLVAVKTKKIPYLVKTIDKWEEQQLTSDTPESATCLKIPDEAIELLYSESNNSKYHFVRLNGDLMSVADILDGEEYWYKDKLKYKNWGSVNVVWQRTPKTLPTHPEELPFIDDEQKMTDIEKTLNERQSQYGDFSDVAELTQGLLSVMSKYGYDDMPNAHKESIHMIASKLARIVNGDCDYIENWHDISGYATLMERELKTKEGATNAKVIRTKIINGIIQEI